MVCAVFRTLLISTVFLLLVAFEAHELVAFVRRFLCIRVCPMPPPPPGIALFSCSVWVGINHAPATPAAPSAAAPSALSLPVFRRELKTVLFRSSFPDAI